MSFAPEIKTRAFELFLELGGKTTLVHKKLCEEYGYSSPKEITLRKWFKEGNLSEVQKNLQTDALVLARTKQVDKLIQRREEHKDLYKRLIDKSGNKLFGNDSLEFVTAIEATKALDMGIQGERKITTEQLNLQFVEDLFNAVMATVRDENVLKEIGIEFRKVLSKYKDD